MTLPCGLLSHLLLLIQHRAFDNLHLSLLNLLSFHLSCYGTLSNILLVMRGRDRACRAVVFGSNLMDGDRLLLSHLG